MFCLCSLSNSRKLGRDLAQFDAWQQLKIFQQRLHMEKATAMAAAGQETDEDEDDYLPALARVIANNNQGQGHFRVFPLRRVLILFSSFSRQTIIAPNYCGS